MMNAKQTWKGSIKGWLYILPMLIGIAIFSIYPILKSFSMSFYTDYQFLTDTVLARGWGNFTYLFSDGDFHLAVVNTLIYVAGAVPLTIIFSLLFAVLLFRIKWLSGFFRTVYFLPFVTSTIAISMVWTWIFNARSGLANYFLGLVGIHPIDWLNDPKYAMLTLIIISIWKGLGFNIILLMAGLGNIDKRYMNAARIDGANAWQIFWHVTLPQLSPTILFVFINGVIVDFKVFDEVFAVFGGQPGPAQSAMTMVFYIYQQFYVMNQYGRAAAASVILFIMILIVTVLQLLISRHFDYRRPTKVRKAKGGVSL
ncbi:MAG: sugar ABC transporter permease [Oenococcus sp.]|uniref:N-Acetyl-D-glucosamine ABC transport system permease protein 1 n=1 Tax=Oenococcus kitaharae DSM 17330 TaxID=1045004 RepID=G9WF16_9LACO|nr:sugar ABC transporter permease [Oenococcus kitaharae]EHN58576.1 N-Acetyl-D-glucosamine ABC transport system permease protein 1 [Oenococcus kitaharae DSM 17330]MCV3296197.1 sugar ABC transporter permease [Oenococcus kitaharae]